MAGGPVLASLALALAATGVFGVVSKGVAEQRRQSGIRPAIGASPGRALRHVLGVRGGDPIALGGAAARQQVRRP